MKVWLIMETNIQKKQLKWKFKNMNYRFMIDSSNVIIPVISFYQHICFLDLKRT